ncbi:Transposase DDE domain-containing protein [Anaerovirgula multivorans]|uniref:Transposase DDE domain-containing protein n=1 Tax=Anaerovirgula multivorans TaxID=312168 RepID=A0A239GH60_9FIRM|nr:Transposase DDE domain-containing protein [Anaerovirgula multivorans]
MIRLLVLQYLYNLSDERVIEEVSLNLTYMWFLKINPDEDLPDASLLSKFRVHRLRDITLDEIIIEIVKQCVDKGIIKDKGISIDATHTQANTFKAIPERVMKRLAKRIFKTYEKEIGTLPEDIEQNIPDYKGIEDKKEAKKVMKNYLEAEIKKVENTINPQEHSKTHKVVENAKAILQDPKFIEQRGVRSIVDQDARVGHKSKTADFFGYKNEYIITTHERIITAITVANGAYVDGTRFEELIELTKKTGLKPKEVYGDKAYFRKPILDTIKEMQARAYIPVSEMAYKIDEERFSYNKDSDEWFCSQGNKTINKKHRKDKSGKQTYKYYFEKEKCRECTKRAGKDKGTGTCLRKRI